MFFLVAFLFACSSESAPTATPAAAPTAAPTATPTATPTADHADAGVKPGSHEDWCPEHALPESQCTLCNPALAVAFKATGDWCEEHALPESHCKKCNPELKIERPPKIQ